MAVSCAEFLRDAATDQPTLRRGQAFFNALRRLRPDLAEQLRTSGSDPFYNDAQIPMATAWLRERWSSDGGPNARCPRTPRQADRPCLPSA